MKSRPIVFLGPSLARDAARTILEADFRPPLRTGDLDYFSASDTILIVDGEFGSTTALSPAEVQRAADRGVTFLGAASTGAMLAAQLPDLISGLGWVYGAFLDGRIRSSDDIAILYRPDTLAPLTFPAVTVLRWLETLLENDLIDENCAERIAGAVRAIPLSNRHLDSLHDTLGDIIGPRRFAKLLGASGGSIANIKTEDAKLALRSVPILST